MEFRDTSGKRAICLPVVMAGLLLVFASVALMPSAARAATANVTVSADPTEEKPVTVTVTGQTEVSRWVFAAAFPEEKHQCDASDPSKLDDGQRVMRFVWAQAGNYEVSGDFAPRGPGQYRICVFLADGLWNAPNARTSKSILVRAARATSEIAVSPDPVANAPVTVTISGESEVLRYLWVGVFYSNAECDEYEPTLGVAGGWGGEHLLKAKLIRPGSYRENVTIFPPRAGAFRVCSFIATEVFGKVFGRGSGLFEARLGRAQMSVTPQGSFRHLSEGHFSVKGTTEVPASLRTFTFWGVDGCPDKPQNLQSSESEQVEAGAFEQNGWYFTPRFAGPGWICAYLARDRGKIVGVASAEIFVKPNPAFAPKLFTRKGKVGYGRLPLLKWDYGPKNMNLAEYFQIYRVKPKGPKPTVRGPKPTRGIHIDGRTHKSGGSSRSGLNWVRILRYLPPGRYWWRVIRQDRVSKYWEASQLRWVTIASPKR